MGGELLPLPLVRFRERKVGDVFRDAAGLNEGGYEIPRTIKVMHPILGAVKTIGNCIVIFMMFFYCAYVEKGYLTNSPIQGYSRVTLQHPVDHCNPLKAHCKSNMTAFNDLPYCNSANEHEHEGSDNKTHKIKCKYMDTFDTNVINAGLSQGNLVIPTRISTFTQTVNEECSRKDKPCTNPYKVTGEKHEFVADIEDFTLLIDHGYSCPDLGIRGASWATIGFYVPWSTPNTTGWNWAQSWFHKRAKPKYIPCINEKSKDCFYSKEHQKKMQEEETPHGIKIPIPKTKGLLRRTTDNYDSTGPGFMTSTSFGDIVKVSDLLKIANISLEDRNYGSNNLRTEGEVIIIEIAYTNYNYFHWPNNLEPSYEYRIYHIPADSFKTTRVTESSGVRTVSDVHGLEIITRVTGTLGKTSLKVMALSLVELSILLGLVHWVLHCVALNFAGSQGRKIEEKGSQNIHPELSPEGILQEKEFQDKKEKRGDSQTAAYSKLNASD